MAEPAQEPGAGWARDAVEQHAKVAAGQCRLRRGGDGGHDGESESAAAADSARPSPPGRAGSEEISLAPPVRASLSLRSRRTSRRPQDHRLLRGLAGT